MPPFTDIHGTLEAIVRQEFSTHPFSTSVSPKNFEVVIANYLTMSMAFPYLQAGAQLRLLMHYIEQERDTTRDVEITAAVGAFLTWDEIGGHAIVREFGNAGLPKILDTDQFHSSLLQKDIETLTGKNIPPAFHKVTKDYLRDLEFGLSSIDPATRVAHMVAFEKHAGRMIDALWSSASAIFNVDKDKLGYFSTHVGGEDPAEDYHIKMTSRMIEEVIPEEDSERFLEFFQDAYELNFRWCGDICQLTP